MAPHGYPRSGESYEPFLWSGVRFGGLRHNWACRVVLWSGGFGSAVLGFTQPCRDGGEGRKPASWPDPKADATPLGTLPV